MQDRISVQQPPRSGNDYPFLSSGEQLATVLLDMAIEHPADAKLPLRLSLAQNLNADASNGHTMRLVIVDRESTVVFDTAAGTYRSQHLWGDYYATYTWSNANNQLLRFTIGSANQDGFPALLNNIDATIDPRTYLPVLPGVKRLRVFNGDFGLLDVSGNDVSVRLKRGYNTTYELEDDSRRNRSGGTVTKGLTLSAVPQQGLGQYPGCGDQENPFVRSINQQTPAAAGGFLLNGDSCFRVEPNVTFNEAGVATIVHGSLNLFDDCEACCNCDDYLRPYYAIQRAKRRAEPLAEQLDSTRRRYIDAKNRLELTLNCLLARELRLEVSTPQECQISLLAGVFNGGVRPIYSVGLDIRILWQDANDEWFPADVYHVPALGVHLANGVSEPNIPLVNLGGGRIQAMLNCVPPEELHRVMFSIVLFASRKTKICLGFQGADDDQYICRDVTTSCAYSLPS